MANEVGREHFQPFLDILKKRAEVVSTLEDHDDHHRNASIVDFTVGMASLCELVYAFSTDAEYDEMLDDLAELQKIAESNHG